THSGDEFEPGRSLEQPVMRYEWHAKACPRPRPPGWRWSCVSQRLLEGGPLLVGHVLNDQTLAGRQWLRVLKCLVGLIDPQGWLFRLLDAGHDLSLWPGSDNLGGSQPGIELGRVYQNGGSAMCPPSAVRIHRSAHM